MKKILKKLYWYSIAALLFTGIGMTIAGTIWGGTVQAEVPETIIKTITQDPVFVVLNRIADCESGNGKTDTGTQYGKDGQVILRANTNGTIDIGKYQVNKTYWGAQAGKLGYDLTKEEDNYQMARWIYLNKGTTDWSASQHCWYR